jgi:hypothetical protein
MYQIWIWDEDLLEFIPERRDGKRVEFEHWEDANDAAYWLHRNDGILRKVEYKGGRKAKRA